jgi:hypothetical protein
MQPKKIAVAGATGRVGHHVVDAVFDLGGNSVFRDSLRLVRTVG